MPDPIVSLQNQRIKNAIKLRDRRGRDKQRRIIVDGLREMRQAIGAKLSWGEAFVCEALIDEDAQAVVVDLESAGAEIVPVSRDVFAKLAFGQRAEGVVAVAETPARILDAIDLPPAPAIAVLEGLEKPGNVGAVLRSADAAGISAVLVANGHTDLFNPNTIRASQGAVFTLPIATATSAEVIAWLRNREFRIFAARVDADTNYQTADLAPPSAIVLGSEADGLSAAWADENVVAVGLPMLGTVDSLNVSVTAGVLFYEALRQRDSHGERGGASAP